MTLLRWPDLVVITLSVLGMLAIGVICSRRNNTAEKFFLAGRSMPGWILGFSFMATIVSSMTFLALPAFTFERNWYHFPGNCTYLVAILAAYFLFIPFYRVARIDSAYEYLERRFGVWARWYAATCFVLFQIFRMGVVLYVVSLSIQIIIGGDLPAIVLVAGLIVAAYSIAGGLEAVIWTDLFQGIALIGGGLICTPILVRQLPGGFQQIFQVAAQDGKFSLGNTGLDLTERTVWAIVLAKLVIFLQIFATDQMSVQRYCAAKSDRDARKAVLLGGLLTVPVWTYFMFVGTALYVFYKVLPDPEVMGLKPDQVLPHFILTQVPAGLAGFVIVGILAAAMSTLDSSINAAAATVTTDFYGRLFVRNRSAQHYAVAGRLFSLLFGIIMIGTAIVIDRTRSQEAIENMQTVMLSILGGGLLSLFLIGFLTQRVGSISAMIAVAVTVAGVSIWLLLRSPISRELFPELSSVFPNPFWIGVFANLVLFCVAYTLSFFVRERKTTELAGLTIWTPKPGAGDEGESRDRPSA